MDDEVVNNWVLLEPDNAALVAPGAVTAEFNVKLAYDGEIRTIGVGAIDPTTQASAAQELEKGVRVFLNYDGTDITDHQTVPMNDVGGNVHKRTKVKIPVKNGKTLRFKFENIFSAGASLRCWVNLGIWSPEKARG